MTMNLNIIMLSTKQCLTHSHCFINSNCHHCWKNQGTVCAMGQHRTEDGIWGITVFTVSDKKLNMRAFIYSH